MSSLDVKALFINVPLKKTINMINNSLFKDQQHVNHLSKQEFSTLLDMASSESINIYIYVCIYTYIQSYTHTHICTNIGIYIYNALICLAHYLTG